MQNCGLVIFCEFSEVRWDKNRTCPTKSGDLFRLRLDELTNATHPLVQLTRHIGWSVFERKWVDFYHHRGLPGMHRLVALQHSFAPLDEEVTQR
jgi:hypothetical protein